MATLRLVLAYDGEGFSGFAANSGVRTVEGVLLKALQRPLGGEIAGLTCAGRTDAGVHAAGQVVSLEVPDMFGREGTEASLMERLVKSLNRMCAPEIAVLSAHVEEEGFNARFDAIARRYRYEIWNSPTPNPLLRSRLWHVREPLEQKAMSAAAATLLGEHDFASFCRRSTVVVDEQRREAPTVRKVTRAAWDRVGDHQLRFEIEANSFCRQMVRSLVGTLADVGRGRISPDGFQRILTACDRSRITTVAPPHGLCLMSVGYPS